MNYVVDPSRRNSLDQEGGVRERSVVLVRERKLVPVDLVRSGMMRFSFLLETCHPGSIPDPQLIAAVLDLVSLSAYSSLLVSFRCSTLATRSFHEEQGIKACE